VTSRYFGLENNIVVAVLWIADEGLVRGEEERWQLQLHCASCFDFNRKLSSGTINVLVERVVGYDTMKYQVVEIPGITISCVLYKRKMTYGIYIPMYFDSSFYSQLYLATNVSSTLCTGASDKRFLLFSLQIPR
jgi:acyl CoA:acetate/3-ketoacid CoA transferase